MYRKIYIPLLLASCFALVLATLYGCANPGSGPDGGPYDETPPKIVEMYPELGATQRTDKKVSILFNELIKVENISEKVIVSPPQIEMPEIKAVGRKISVSLLDSLKPETTYTIDFSDAIVDNNEGNPFGNFTYYFSTGTQIDTMEVAGHVLSAEDLEPQKGVLVGLHKNLQDSAFVKLPFDRVARTDGNGRFCIKGVAPGNYRIYALKDMDGDFRYAPGELLAFSRDTIVPRAIADVRRDTLWRDTVHIDTVKLTPITRYAPDDVVLLSFTEKRNSRMLLKTQRDVPEWFRVYFTAPSADVPVVKGLKVDEKDAFLEQRATPSPTGCAQAACSSRTRCKWPTLTKRPTTLRAWPSAAPTRWNSCRASLLPNAPSRKPKNWRNGKSSARSATSAATFPTSSRRRNTSLSAKVSPAHYRRWATCTFRFPNRPHASTPPPFICNSSATACLKTRLSASSATRQPCSTIRSTPNGGRGRNTN
ncbi:MAG: Ig-like domain-containing domain [Bacteroidales bacterium]